MKYILPLILLILTLLFPQKAYCNENLTLSLVEYNELGELNWRSVEAAPLSSSHIRARIESTLKALLAYEAQNVYIYPQNISILSIRYLFGCVSIDLSDDFNDFGGGSMVEQIYLAQIVKTLLDIEGVEKVTLLIDGQIGNTTEGIVIREVNSWQELMEGKIMSTGS